MQEASLRSLLFVPATRPERIAKALAGEADAVIVDLEDAVAAEAKEEARRALDDFLTHAPQTRLLVRTNAAQSPEFSRDLALCARHAGVAGIMLPKADGAAEIERVHAASGKPVWPLIESAGGLVELPALARARGVARLSIGALDLAADLDLIVGSEGAEALLDQCRLQLVVHSRAAGLAPPVESVIPDIEDLDRVARVARRAAEMGFGGMLSIHPRQLAPIHRAFVPGDDEIAWARGIVAAAETNGGAFRLDGRMVDAPVIARARRLLTRAGEG